MSEVEWRYGSDGKVNPDPAPTEQQLFADDGTYDIESRQAGGDWEHAGDRRNIYLAMEFANTLIPGPKEVRVVKRHND